MRLRFKVESSGLTGAPHLHIVFRNPAYGNGFLRHIRDPGQHAAELFIERLYDFIEPGDPVAHFAHRGLRRVGVGSALLQLSDLRGSGVFARLQLFRFGDRGSDGARPSRETAQRGQ